MKRLLAAVLALLLCASRACAQQPTIAFLNRVAGVDQLELFQNGDFRQLTHGGALTGNVNWSRDGTKLAFTADNLIYRINADGSHLVRLSLLSDVTGTSGDLNPDWSPDGSRIIYTHMEIPGGDPNQRRSALFTMSAVDGSNQTVLLGNGVNVFDQAHFSPDGTQLTFDSDLNGPKNVPNIFACQAARCPFTLRQLTHLSAAGSPMWSPDGSKIIFEEAQAAFGGYGEIATVNSADGSGFTVLTSFVEPSRDPGEPAYSSDGRTIIMAIDDCTNSPLGSACWGQGDPNAPTTIWTMNADGSNQINTNIVCAVAGSPRYAPAGGPYVGNVRKKR